MMKETLKWKEMMRCELKKLKDLQLDEDDNSSNNKVRKIIIK